jgi:N,N-dimethylformamidase
VPAELQSGVYALRLQAEGSEDRIPFIVRPPRDRATSKVALLLSTFTYAAYANFRDPGMDWSHGDWVPEYPPEDHQMWRHPEWGGSAYDVHSDGSGSAISSLVRPVPNMRPNYRDPLVHAGRHFGADLYFVHWLDQAGIPFDVIGDEDVHADGVDLLSRYRTVITSSHPEYWSGPMLDAAEEYTDNGGRLMYLGGNGFYWVTTIAPEEGVTIEVRRGEAGTRIWNGYPGEGRNQFTGEPGGLWRYRGRTPHSLLGIGFVAEGWAGDNVPYYRQPASFLPEVAWAFEGIGDEEPIGEDGLVMGGAAGDELDSAEAEFGSPEETLVLASSRDHSDAYWLVVEDVLYNQPDLSGTTNPRVHADITLLPKRNGGAVFSVGSISWSGSLSHNDYDNPVARLSENVLRVFASGESPWLDEAESTPEPAQPVPDPTT